MWNSMTMNHIASALPFPMLLQLVASVLGGKESTL